MICRERKEDWVMVDQHQHGLLAGEFALAMNSAIYRSNKRWNEAVYAVKDHDRGWIDLDDEPFLNDALHEPYTFLDFPIATKLTFYSKGLDEIQLKSPYAALLCSMHYDRLLNQANIEHPAFSKYMQQEQKRRDCIQLELGITELATDSELIYDLNVLRFCDDLSLYLCLNEPGADKEQEFPWWREGFPMSDEFDCADGNIIQAHWINSDTVELSPFPFDRTLSVDLTCVIVSKIAIKEVGISEAYATGEVIHYSFQIQGS